ncbi:MAG: hypothetical protein KDA41_11815, partial [Planctomycetales bacterium]|nr:hypothetical protein [Planctomycetales bacterium]
MTQRLFKVDLSDEARDFQATATEPGLAMLDRNNANYMILRRWLGEFVAEPEWVGQDVHFYLRLEDRGRPEQAHCVPCSKADLLGPLQPQLEELDQKLRKAKTETANEQLLQRIIRKQFADHTRDYDASDFACHFFKCRVGGEPWRLVWCWGYQRTDLEPAKAIICGNDQCEALYTKRPKQKARCPVCASTARRGRKPAPPLWLRISQLALLLLLLLGGALFFMMNQPRIVASPDDWEGPPGSRVQYQVRYKAWYFWDDDVSDKVMPQSHDKRIVRFDPSGTLAKARAPGRALVEFHYKNMIARSNVRVGPPKQPKLVRLEPGGDVKVAVGSTQQMTLIGEYEAAENLDPVDLTEMAQWRMGNESIAFCSQGLVEGASQGSSDVTASYRASESDPYLDVIANVFVTAGDYQSIEVAVEPAAFALGQSGRIAAFGVDSKGEKYSLAGSSLLRLSVEPASVARVDDGYLVGLGLGKATLSAELLDFAATSEFEVTGSNLAYGTFAVSPASVAL